MNKKIRFGILGVVVLVVISLFFIFKEERQQYMFLIPEGYKGEVTVTFDQPNAPSLTSEHKFIVFEVPSSGKIETSDSNITGTIDYYYVDAKGNRTKIEDTSNVIQDLHTESGGSENANGQKNNMPETLSFFVGTPQEYKNSAN
ncbi:hypothetical protein QCD85_13410 [Paenibacillus sp. PsM32]|uniref:DUF6843 domain-containing protein n=1 Tax=Paenibacillus sp. PsM32 TaxID=3030536 RepID=UPI00263A7BD1|nr:hypothetical protein [Paenibacillus sp. PsM32]MDN4619098.1 hypothetical protein [Paenibacillus sp. PsM32]